MLQLRTHASSVSTATERPEPLPVGPSSRLWREGSEEGWTERRKEVRGHCLMAWRQRFERENGEGWVGRCEDGMEVGKEGIYAGMRGRTERYEGWVGRCEGMRGSREG